MDDLRLSHYYDKLHGGPLTKSVLFASLPTPWDISAIHIEVAADDDDDGDNSQATHVNLADTIRLRDWLIQVIDAAGPRPLHPMLDNVLLDTARVHPPTIFVTISDRLYELDALKAGTE